MYVPRDEAFEEEKQEMFRAGERRAKLHGLLPSIVASLRSLETGDDDFRGFHEVDSLFKEGLGSNRSLFDHILHKVPFVKEIQEFAEGMLRFDTPHIIANDKFAWMRDDEFARQTLAGINPVSIERLRALEENKLYILDYHDTYLPFIDQINAQDGRKAYATRTLFYLTDLGTLKPIAIELSLPPMTKNCPRAKRVLTPPADATTSWLWQLAKAHVCANDAGVHQLINHWLRTHACVEPFIIAAHRQLSAMHPILKLLKPHMRYTLQINALARQTLVNAGGVVESGFTPGKFCMEMSAAAGMAVEDPREASGVRLVIEDYPYAADGLLLWSAMERWVRTYVAAYYPTPHRLRADAELQRWYAEALRSGHPDKRHAPGWPPLAAPADAAALLTTLLWLASAHHAALNFAQFPLGAYPPARPALLRRLLPDDPHHLLAAGPHRFFLGALPGIARAAAFAAVADTLSTHSGDEEYLAGERRGDWTGDAEMARAERGFAAEVRRAGEEIARRNADPARRNRCGAGVPPYELMAPTSGPGVTCRGVPNSITI
ncbi:putative lipoxygenase 5, partial [Ananas comosus]